MYEDLGVHLFSSLVTRLSIAILASLLLSLSIATVVFVVQLRTDDRTNATVTLQRNVVPIYGQIVGSLLSAPSQYPLADTADMRALGVDRVLVTRWPDDEVLGDTNYDGGAPPQPHYVPLSYSSDGLSSTGEIAIDGSAYVYLAKPLQEYDEILTARAGAALNIHNIIVLKHVFSSVDVVGQVFYLLAGPSITVLLVTFLGSVLVLHTQLRPLHALTRAAHSMAKGNYAQRVEAGKTNDEIGRLSQAFNHMTSEVTQAREIQRQFVANVSHDLRSPLTSIIGFSQVLMDDKTIGPQQKIAAIINSEAERMYRLTMDLLDLARLESGQFRVSKQRIDINAILQDITLRYRDLPNVRRVQFMENLGDGALPVQGDPDRLTQIVTNLLDNALKFCEPDGNVRLTTFRQDRMGVIQVSNTGSEIAAADLPHVFDRFYRGDHSRAQQTGGSGIGLAIVRELVRTHGGTAMAASQHGNGVTISVHLPLIDESDE